MAAWTINSTTSNGEFIMVDAYNTDSSTSTELIAAITGSLLLKSLTVTMDDTDGRWFKIFNDSDLQIGPVKPYNRQWHRDYETPFEFTGAINVQTESDRQIHICLAYKNKPLP